MIPDVTVEEVSRLARAMTWKFAVASVPYAGAKAGIRFTGGDRDAILGAFLDRVYTWREVFLTGPDMGTNPPDFLRFAAEGETPMWARSHDGMSMDDLAVGAGILGGTRVVLEHLDREFGASSVAIEGFGKAGAGTARAIDRAGGRVVAVSTIEGALVDPEGLDIDELLALKARARRRARPPRGRSGSPARGALRGRVRRTRSRRAAGRRHGRVGSRTALRAGSSRRRTSPTGRARSRFCTSAGSWRSPISSRMRAASTYTRRPNAWTIPRAACRRWSGWSARP